MHVRMICLFMFLMATNLHAGKPLWTFTPITPVQVNVPVNAGAEVKYIVTNQSTRPHTLSFKPITGISQATLGAGLCSNPFELSTQGDSCILALQINGSQLSAVIHEGPVVCQAGGTNQCYRPSEADLLHIIPEPAINPLPSGCVATENNNIQCEITIDSQTNDGFTNMTYALCRSAQCDYDGSQKKVICDCDVIKNYEGVYSASVSPDDYNTSKPSGNLITSTYSRVNSSGETPTNCTAAPFANCFGAVCTMTGPTTATCKCPVVTTEAYIAPETDCTLTDKIWSATSVASFPAIDGAMTDMYDEFFNGQQP